MCTSSKGDTWLHIRWVCAASLSGAMVAGRFAREVLTVDGSSLTVGESTGFFLRSGSDRVPEPSRTDACRGRPGGCCLMPKACALCKQGHCGGTDLSARRTFDHAPRPVEPRMMQGYGTGRRYPRERRSYASWASPYLRRYRRCGSPWLTAQARASPGGLRPRRGTNRVPSMHETGQRSRGSREEMGE